MFKEISQYKEQLSKFLSQGSQFSNAESEKIALIWAHPLLKINQLLIFQS